MCACRLKVGRRQGCLLRSDFLYRLKSSFRSSARYHSLRISNAMLLSQMTSVTSRCLLKRLARSRLTASLHFTEAHLLELGSAGIDSTPLVLHVGSGTFYQFGENAEDVRQHSMHHERYEIPEETIKKIAKTKANGGRVIAVGTTAVRALESFATTELEKGDTNLFIYPGYEFQLVDAMITDFHQPRTTLLMMVREVRRKRPSYLYNQAIASNFRLFSYGDAMFLERAESER